MLKHRNVDKRLGLLGRGLIHRHPPAQMFLSYPTKGARIILIDFWVLFGQTGGYEKIVFFKTAAFYSHYVVRHYVGQFFVCANGAGRACGTNDAKD